MHCDASPFRMQMLHVGRLWSHFVFLLRQGSQDACEPLRRNLADAAGEAFITSSSRIGNIEFPSFPEIMRKRQLSQGLQKHQYDRGPVRRYERQPHTVAPLMDVGTPMQSAPWHGDKMARLAD